MISLLVVDDQAGIRLLLKEVFEKAGISTDLAANGLEALKLFSEKRFSAVLLDVKMPGMSGIEVLQNIRLSNSEIPVFMMSAYGEQELLEQATELKVSKFYTKPFNIFEVRDEILKMIAASKL